MGESSVKRERVVVHGNVQGVFFRENARRRAQQEGLSGWIRNRSDGTVEAVFEGTPDRVARLVAFCEQGPRGARVARVERFEEEPEGLNGFRVT
jgi:acylphosphatase